MTLTSARRGGAAVGTARAHSSPHIVGFVIRRVPPECCSNGLFPVLCGKVDAPDFFRVTSLTGQNPLFFKKNLSGTIENDIG